MIHELFILRHGIAVEVGTPGYTEETRELTPEGIEKMILATQGMKRLGIEFDALFASPLKRAQQTAEIVKKYLPFQGKIETEELLCPGSSLPLFLKKLSLRKEKRFMIVGHEPTLSQWAQNLLGCERGNSILLKKGALCHLILHGELPRVKAELVALLQPRALRQSAG